MCLRGRTGSPGIAPFGAIPAPKRCTFRTGGPQRAAYAIRMATHGPNWPSICQPWDCPSRTNVLISDHAAGVSRGALPVGPEPGQGHDVRLVAEPVHGLRPPVHVLLRPGVREARGSAVGRPLRRLDPGQDERRRGAPARAGAAELEGRDGRDRRGDGPVPAGRGSLPADSPAASRSWPRRRTRSRSSRAAR